MSEALMVLAQSNPGLAFGDLANFFGTAWSYVLIFAGFSLVIFMHELGHFMAAKLSDVKVDRFAVGFGRAIVAYRRGVGLTWGPTQPALDRRIVTHVQTQRGMEPRLKEKVKPSEAEIAAAMKELGIGETEYCFNALPLGGYVKMLGQEDFAVDKSGEMIVKADPRAFTHKPIGVRMFIVSAGVFMNLVFAAATFALVFMIGWQAIPAEVGQIQPGMPADQVGLRIGDRIVRVNNQAIADQDDLKAAIGLSNPDEAYRLTYQRKDPATGAWKTETVSISPEMSPENNVLRIGVAPPLTNEVALVYKDPDLSENQQIKPGDRIAAVNGRPTESFYQIQELLADQKGEWTSVTVERPADAPASRSTGASDSARPARTKRVDLRWRARQYLEPTGKANEQSGHLLGLVPRQRVKETMYGQRAEAAEFRAGDIIVRWGGQISPRLDEIISSRRENPEREIRVVVYRASEGEKTLSLIPKGGGVLSHGVPEDGIIWGSQENDRLVVADIATNVTDQIKTPAAALKDVMPRGSLLTKVNDKPVQTWTQLARTFVALAGTKVKLSWTSPGAGEQSGTIDIPETIGACKAKTTTGAVTDFVLPGSWQIISIDGTTRREIEINGKRASLDVNHWRTASEILRGCVGKDVKVVYEDCLDRKPREVMVHVTAEMADAWTLRTRYVVDDVMTFPRSMILRETNPFKASLIGLRKTWWFIEQVYLLMQRMIFTRTMSVEQVSGPVGIVQMGSQVAAAGYTQLMYFLALISANLAVINFLPLPIMDGGVFMFLLIEKIKGSALSIRVQVGTQLIGLFLIIGIFLFVTYQDVSKMEWFMHLSRMISGRL